MNPREKRNEARTQVVRELGSMLRRQARGRWAGVDMAKRREQGHQVWRFRPSADAGERFLHVSVGAIDRARSSSRKLFEQLKAGRWLNRLDEGGEVALRLGADGQLRPYPAAR
jgi:hypothetical protein